MATGLTLKSVIVGAIVTLLVVPMPLPSLAQEGRPQRSIASIPMPPVQTKLTRMQPPPQLTVRKTQFQVNGQESFLIEKLNAANLVVEQVLLSGDRAVISIDRAGDGHLDLWQLVTPGKSVTLSQPHNGRFVMMEVEQYVKDRIVSMKFSLDEKGDYRLYAAKSRKNKKLFQSLEHDVVVGCRATDMKEHQLAAQVNEALKSGDPLTDILTQIMDRKCFTGQFAGASNDIVEGIKSVFKSDHLWNHQLMSHATSAAEIGSGRQSITQRGQYLQCLRYLKLDTHASRIAAAPAKFMMGAEVRGLKVTCDASITPDSDGLVAGSYQLIGNTAEITLALRGRRPTSASNKDAYAQTFFHEALHYSKIADEPLTHLIERCCSSPPGVPDEQISDCVEVKKILRHKENGQRFEAQVIRNFGDKHNLYRDMLRNTYGPAADQIMDDFYESVGRSYTELNDDPRCRAERNGPLYGQCEKEFKQRLDQVVDQYFGSGDNTVCRVNAARNMSETEAKRFCDQLNDAMEAFVGLNPADVGSICSGNRRPPPKPGQSGRIRALLPHAFAASYNWNQALCDLASDVHPRFTPITSGDSTDVLLGTQRRTDQFQRDDRIDTAERSTGTIRPSTGSQTTSARQREGPRQYGYSRNPSERAWRIEREAARQDNLFGKRLNEITERVMRPLVPAASASENQPNRAVAKSDTLPLANVPEMSVPSPILPALTDNQALQKRHVASANTATQIVPGQPSRESTDQATAQMRERNARMGERIHAAPAASSARVASGVQEDGSSDDGGGGAKARSTASTKREQAARALATRILLRDLQRPYHIVKPELGKPSVKKELKEYEIQVIDDEHEVHGSGFPKHRLEYNARKDRLVPKPESSR